MDILSFILGLQKGKKMAGGGSTATGIYWKKNFDVPFTAYNAVVFVFKGQVYVYQKTSGTTTVGNIYKYENDTLSLVVSHTFEGEVPTNGTYTRFYEIDGELHIIYGYNTVYHCVWDGENTFTQLANLGLGRYLYCTGYKNSLYFISESNTSNIYEWDKSTDTWNLLYTFVNPTGRSNSVSNISDCGDKFLLSTSSETFELNLDTLTPTLLYENLKFSHAKYINNDIYLFHYGNIYKNGVLIGNRAVYSDTWTSLVVNGQEVYFIGGETNPNNKFWVSNPVSDWTMD